MPETILSCLAAFAGTNIDDIFINMFFFSEADTPAKVRSVVIGKYLGTALLLLLGFLGASGLRFFTGLPLDLLGLFPIILGIKGFFCYLKQKNSEETELLFVRSGTSAWNVMFVTISSGADNIGVYIPLFTEYSSWQMLAAVFVFAVMTALWCLLGKKIADLPLLQSHLAGHRHIVAPILYILLGFYILLK